jgi:hypothetical protein
MVYLSTLARYPMVSRTDAPETRPIERPLELRAACTPRRMANGPACCSRRLAGRHRSKAKWILAEGADLGAFRSDADKARWMT